MHLASTDDTEQNIITGDQIISKHVVLDVDETQQEEYKDFTDEVDDLDLETANCPLETSVGEILSPYLNIIDSGNLGSSKSTNKSMFSMQAHDNHLLIAVNKLGIGLEQETHGAQQHNLQTKES